MDKKKIEQHYQDVKSAISDAMRTSFTDDVNNEEENAFVEGIKKQLQELNENFKSEIDELEQSSEWDRFCISFFGETNAGKSTIIESLRIIYNEESRLQTILENEKNAQLALNANMEAYSRIVQETRKLKEFAKQNKNIGKSRAVPVVITIVVMSVVFAGVLALLFSLGAL